jgi:hypothetical protein
VILYPKRRICSRPKVGAAKEPSYPERNNTNHDEKNVPKTK